MTSGKLNRRRLVIGTAALSTALVAAPFVRGAYAAGKLSLGFWDHWVPKANDATTALINEWAASEKVEVTIDYITSQGNKLLLTGAAESQARAGHDVFGGDLDAVFLAIILGHRLAEAQEAQRRAVMGLAAADRFDTGGQGVGGAGERAIADL